MAGPRGTAWLARLKHARTRARERTRLPAAYQATWRELVRHRIASVAPAVAVLNLLWIPLDPLVLDPPLAWRILPVRLAMATALVLLGRRQGRLAAITAVWVLLAIQATGFALIEFIAGPGDGLRAGYGIFPFVLVAQLSAFPLAWTQTLRAAAVPAALVLGLLADHHATLGRADWQDLWLFALVTAVAAWSSQVQLGLLLDLLGARHEASVDALTGLANRRAVERRLAVEVARARRFGEPLSVIMLDLDHFKEINDRWGHPDGDRVLVAVAHAMRRELRDIDLAARFGGEEFLLVLPRTGPDQAGEVGERIRAAIANLRIELPRTRVEITVSLGAACWSPGEDPATLVERADRALYRAKASGRNRYCVDGPSGA